jgi:O-antigen/teichoic acid export membrane protein
MKIKEIRKKTKQYEKFLLFYIVSLIGESIFYIIPLVIAKFTNPEFLGSVSVIQMITMLAITIFLTTSQTPIIVFANKKTSKRNQIFSIQLLTLSIALIASLIFLIFSKQLINYASIDGLKIGAVISFYISLVLKSFFSNYLFSLNKKQLASIFTAINGVIILITILLINKTNSFNINNFLYTYLVATIISMLFFVKQLFRKDLLPIKFEKKVFTEILKWSVWQFFGLLSSYLINWGDNLILKIFVPIEEIGIYNLSYQFFKGLIGASFLINSYFLPFLSKNINNNNKVKRYFYEKRIKILFLTTLLTILIYIFTPLFIKIFYGERYLESIKILRILLIGFFFAFAGVFYLPFFNSSNNYQHVQKTNIIQLIINLSLDYILIKKYGIIGAAIATTTAYTLRFLIDTLYFKKIAKTIKLQITTRYF